MGQPAARYDDLTKHNGKIDSSCKKVVIGGQLAAREGDSHECPSHGGGFIEEHSASVFIEGEAAARQGDLCPCATPSKAMAPVPPVVGGGGVPAGSPAPKPEIDPIVPIVDKATDDLLIDLTKKAGEKLGEIGGDIVVRMAPKLAGKVAIKALGAVSVVYWVWETIDFLNNAGEALGHAHAVGDRLGSFDGAAAAAIAHGSGWREENPGQIPYYIGYRPGLEPPSATKDLVESGKQDWVEKINFAAGYQQYEEKIDEAYNLARRLGWYVPSKGTFDEWKIATDLRRHDGPTKYLPSKHGGIKLTTPELFVERHYPAKWDEGTEVVVGRRLEALQLIAQQERLKRYFKEIPGNINELRGNAYKSFRRNAPSRIRKRLANDSATWDGGGLVKGNSWTGSWKAFAPGENEHIDKAKINTNGQWIESMPKGRDLYEELKPYLSVVFPDEVVFEKCRPLLEMINSFITLLPSNPAASGGGGAGGAGGSGKSGGKAAGVPNRITTGEGTVLIG